MQNPIKTLLFVVAIVVVAVTVLTGQMSRKPATPVSTVAYSCSDQKAILANFYTGAAKASFTPGQPPTPGGSVELALSDGRKTTLAQTLSADGARYATPDESLVFWAKSTTAILLENGEAKNFKDCILIAPNPPGANLPITYSNSQVGFSLRLPTGFVIDERYRYEHPDRTIAGVKFTIAPELTIGTNLSKDSYISIEQLPKRATERCSADLFLERAKPLLMTDGVNNYSVASSTGAAAGNRYRETVYALDGVDPCVAVRTLVHSTAFENYPAGKVRRFDEAKLDALLNAIRQTLVIAQ